MADSTELPDDVHQKIEALSKEGDDLAELREYRKAIEKYVQALELLPEPMTDWEACTWLLTAIGDANFLWGKHEYARKALSDAMHCPGAIGNPLVDGVGDRLATAAEIAATTSSPRSGSISAITTRAPSAAIAIAPARPIPEPPPVTTATLPSSRFAIVLLCVRPAAGGRCRSRSRAGSHR